MNISGIEWVFIFVAALLLFGPKKLPELGKSIGKGIREFKKATSGMLEEEKKPEVPQSSQTPTPVQTQPTTTNSTNTTNTEQK
ncbi:twin-arginine translocase TatA/TatE family subunit [Thermoactinomyces sp. DSM 45892]|uniref:twin-arginine translocase TatA/TatE family subunit n=1 Tax=Thermoactinomyces sp. DSM 45892 TaxID=1882753 RepID=UPI00089C0D0F|nr:twin-arginine translocase TatA/TatE family subunit [Thermoactinomyces sp. DSM 45892]SDY15288.1 twin arginine-targeting protein translocase, TatA/E family [Thermoactinomyces sp. DSM 45892]